MREIHILIGTLLILFSSCNSFDNSSNSYTDFAKNAKIDSIRKEAERKRLADEEKYRMTPLDFQFHAEIAKEKPNFKKLDTLIEKGANINSIHKYSVSVKKLSAKIPIVKDFVTKTHKDVSIEETPLLHQCIRVSRSKFDKNAYKLIAYLLKKGANPYLSTNKRRGHNGKGQNKFVLPLEVIIQNNSFHYPHFETKRAVQKYVQLFKKNDFKMDSMSLLCSDGKLDIIKYLVKEGVPKRIDVGLSFGQFIPAPGWNKMIKSNLSYLKTFELDFSNVDIQTLVFHGKSVELERLLDLGLSPDSKSKKNGMPLSFLVIDKGDRLLDFLKKLIEVYKVDTTVSYKGKSLLTYAKKRGEPEIIKYLEAIVL